MHVLSFAVHNVMRVSDVDLNMAGSNLVLVGGANGHGKSSALKALLMALCGKRDMDWPDVALKEGESEGWVRVNLSGEDGLHDTEGFTVELKMRRRRSGTVAEEIRVLDSTGEEAPEPRALLRRLYNFRAFDPLSFERTKPKEQAELLRELLGLDFSELDEERKGKYEERTRINREGVEKKARLDAIVVPAGTPDEKVSAAELFAELESARQKNAENAQACQDVEKAKRALGDRRSKIVDMQDRIAALQAQLEQELIAEKEAEAAFKAQVDAVSKLEYVEIGPIQERINSADAVNSAVELKLQQKELKAEVMWLRERSQALSDRIAEIDAEKQKRLEEAEWPLEGMSLDEAGVLYNGLPFEQASKAQRTVASVRVGMALYPTLRLLVCEDGNDLDNDTMASLERMLEEYDFQMLLEVVTRSEVDEARCAVVLKDGRPKGEDDGE